MRKPLIIVNTTASIFEPTRALNAKALVYGTDEGSSHGRDGHYFLAMGLMNNDGDIFFSSSGSFNFIVIAITSKSVPFDPSNRALLSAPTRSPIETHWFLIVEFIQKIFLIRSSTDLLHAETGTRIGLRAMPPEAVVRCRAAWARLAGRQTCVVHGDHNLGNIRMTKDRVGLRV